MDRLSRARTIESEGAIREDPSRPMVRMTPILEMEHPCSYSTGCLSNVTALWHHFPFEQQKALVIQIANFEAQLLCLRLPFIECLFQAIGVPVTKFVSPRYEEPLILVPSNPCVPIWFRRLIHWRNSEQWRVFDLKSYGITSSMASWI